VSLGKLLDRLRIDPYILALICTVALASVLPARGQVAAGFGWATKAAIALLFFLHGARLSREAVIQGMGHWRLHLFVMLSTFALFPLLGLIIARVLPGDALIGPLAVGVLFLCCLPSTVQSSIAFTSIARGNVAAAVCAASASNLLGIFVTPLLVGVLISAHGAGASSDEIKSIVLQLLLPFVLGQAARRWIGGWAQKNRALLSYVDRGSIILVVYTAFSEAVVRGIWGQVSTIDLAKLLAVCAVLLAVVLAATAWGARVLGFSKPDEITIVFCGSKKSLATGVPMAGILFSPATVGMIILPLMLFHQIQLMACAVIARRYAARAEA
jgi:sodium/bile acid cotransporter 7